MELIEQFLNLCETNIQTDPRTVHLMETVYRGNVVARICNDPAKYNKLLSDMITNSKRFNTPLPEVEHKIEMSIANFSEADFSGPKPTPQPAPPADFEIKAQTKEPDPNEKLIFELGGLKQEQIEQEFTLESYVAKCESLGHKFKKAPKDFTEAIKSFELYYRKTLGI
jgi:hypothetical protein